VIVHAHTLPRSAPHAHPLLAVIYQPPQILQGRPSSGPPGVLFGELKYRHLLLWRIPLRERRKLSIGASAGALVLAGETEGGSGITGSPRGSSRAASVDRAHAPRRAGLASRSNRRSRLSSVAIDGPPGRSAFTPNKRAKPSLTNSSAKSLSSAITNA